MKVSMHVCLYRLFFHKADIVAFIEIRVHVWKSPCRSGMSFSGAWELLAEGQHRYRRCRMLVIVILFKETAFKQTEISLQRHL